MVLAIRAVGAAEDNGTGVLPMKFGSKSNSKNNVPAAAFFVGGGSEIAAATIRAVPVEAGAAIVILPGLPDGRNSWLDWSHQLPNAPSSTRMRQLGEGLLRNIAMMFAVSASVRMRWTVVVATWGFLVRSRAWRFSRVYVAGSASISCKTSFE
ncbi:MAG: hypothetical protein BWY66_01176 [bacterium ADurb.Bin374]|nr:MAG: hypothetical protein BWY66_01176 [bacterium ADurb.Bin374]